MTTAASRLPGERATPVDVSSIDGNDVEVTGPGGDRGQARFVEVSDRRTQTHVVATYSLPPGGGWTASIRGVSEVAVRPNEFGMCRSHARRRGRTRLVRSPAGQLRIAAGRDRPPEGPVAGTNRRRWITGPRRRGPNRTHEPRHLDVGGPRHRDGRRDRLCSAGTRPAPPRSPRLLGSLKESIAVVVEGSPAVRGPCSEKRASRRRELDLRSARSNTTPS